MATEQLVKELQAEIKGVLELSKNSLVTRPDWGPIRFEAAEKDFQRIFSVTNHLNLLPLELLNDETVSSIATATRDAKNKLTEINNFRIDQGGDPVPRRNGHVSEIRTHANTLFTRTAPWIPILAYERGDVVRNIAALTEAGKEGAKILEDAKVKATKAETELAQIVTRAREAAVKAGAGVFTKDFTNEADELQKESKKWLRVTGLLAVGTVLVALAMWGFTEEKLDQGQLVQKFGSKLVVLVFMFTATLWCGRIYKALRHQSASYRHRGLSLTTFQAFSEGAHDETTKNAVLMETTRCIFGNTSSGFIDQSSSGQDSDIKIIEVVKSMVSSKDRPGG